MCAYGPSNPNNDVRINFLIYSNCLIIELLYVLTVSYVLDTFTFGSEVILSIKKKVVMEKEAPLSPSRLALVVRLPS